MCFIVAACRQISVKQFFAEYWGKKPLIVRRSAMKAATQTSSGSDARISTSEAAHYYTGVFDRLQARDAVVDNELRQFADFAACKYENDERVNLDALDGENGDSAVTAAQFDQVLDTGNTIQFFQPQRRVGCACGVCAWGVPRDCFFPLSRKS